MNTLTYLVDIINDHKTQSEWKIQLTTAINFISSKPDSDKTHIMHAKSDNIEIMIGSETHEIPEDLFKSHRKRYQERLEETMKGSEFVFDGVNVLHNDFHKISLTLSSRKHTCVPFSCYIILHHYLPITLSYDRQIFMRDSGMAVFHIYGVCTVIEYTVVSIYYLKYQCWSHNIKTRNFEKTNFIKQNGVTKSTYK